MQKNILATFCVIAVGMILSRPSFAQNAESNLPFFGAQVFIEPGQTPGEIDTWFRVMKENHMTVCRIRMFESYMHKGDSVWDFSLFDEAFQAAERHGIQVFATLFPATEKTDIGGFKFPRDEQHLHSIAVFIEKLVTHYKNFPALRGWVLINEPGTGGEIPVNDFTRKRYEEWLQNHPLREYTEKGYPVLLDLTDQAFLRDLNTWYLQWIASEIRKYDTVHELHVNNHAIFQNCAEYDFPSWRKFLSHLGGSAHASWHFGYFTRQQYALAMSANCEIIRSGAGYLPWFMTELQGGNNTYSGFAPMCPSSEEITQWLWILLASEARGGIFWSLNPRSSGIEAGEWALLNYQNHPSDRMQAIAQVAETLKSQPELFSELQEVESGIHLLYVRESLWAEKKLASGSAQNYEARKPGAVMKSILAYFEALSELGINTSINAFEEFDFSRNDYTGSVIILSHQISIPSQYVTPLEHFVSHGGKLIVEGLTGFFDENLHNTMKTGFPFERLFGGNISEIKLTDNLFDIRIGNTSLPAHLWRGIIAPGSGQIICSFRNEPAGIRNSFGKGEVVWIPSLLGLGSRINHDFGRLNGWLLMELKDNITSFPVRFASPQKNILMKTAKCGERYLCIIVNKSSKIKKVPLILWNQNYLPGMLFANRTGSVNKYKVIIHPEETIVLHFTKKGS